MYCFCRKKLIVFPHFINSKVHEYLNLVERIIRIWNVNDVSVSIISEDTT